MNANQRIIAIGCLGLMITVSGCANKDVVRKEEAIEVKKQAASKPDTAPQTAKNALSDKNKVGPKSQLPEVPAKAVKQAAKATTSQAAFEKIYFDFDSADLSKSSRDILTHNAEILLKDLKNAKMSIEGNCDERGSAEYNLALGEKRAKAAAQYLVTMGVKPERLTTISYGKERPAVQGGDEAAWAKNRRDEFVITK